MLDDLNVLKQRDPAGVLVKAEAIAEQADLLLEVKQGDSDNREIRQIIVAGMGGSSLAADMIAPLLGEKLTVPYQVVKGYELPAYAGEHTLVIASSYSGNTEETINCYRQALERGCQLAAIASGGKLIELAQADGVAYVQMPAGGIQPRMAMIMNLRGTLQLLGNFGINTGEVLDEMAASREWLSGESEKWTRDVPTEHNYAKQFALLSVGKIPEFFGGPMTAAVAYKWKISWNENAKSLAYMNQYPEFNHNEFIGWSGHPVEKPFVIFDILSDHDPIRITERMELSDRLLSGLRPKVNQIRLAGENYVQEVLWGCVLADFASIYVAILNGVDPEPVVLVEKLKKELS